MNHIEDILGEVPSPTNNENFRSVSQKQLRRVILADHRGNTPELLVKAVKLAEERDALRLGNPSVPNVLWRTNCGKYSACETNIHTKIWTQYEHYPRSWNDGSPITFNACKQVWNSVETQTYKKFKSVIRIPDRIIVRIANFTKVTYISLTFCSIFFYITSTKRNPHFFCIFQGDFKI